MFSRIFLSLIAVKVKLFEQWWMAHHISFSPLKMSVSLG